jgi:hypothetical protein
MESKRLSQRSGQARHLRLAALFFGAVLLVCGQALQVSSVSGAPGEKVELVISLDSPAGSAPAALQWETIFPAQILEDGGNGPEAGRAASDSGKSLTCTRRKTYSYACILVGGQKPVANGPIAIVHFKIRSEAHAGTAVVRVEKAEGATADLKQLTLKDAEGIVTIHY